MTILNPCHIEFVSNIWFSGSIASFTLLPPFYFQDTPSFWSFTSLVTQSVSVVGFSFSLKSRSRGFHYQLEANDCSTNNPLVSFPSPTFCHLLSSTQMSKPCASNVFLHLQSVYGNSSSSWSYLSLTSHRHPVCRSHWLCPQHGPVAWILLTTSTPPT